MKQLPPGPSMYDADQIGRGVFQPANAKSGPYAQSYGTVQRPTIAVSKSNFKKGVAMAHGFVIVAVCLPSLLLVHQVSSMDDVRHFGGTVWASFAYFVVLCVLFLPLFHIRSKLPPWMFLMSVWIPAFAFALVGWHYRDATYNAIRAFESSDCNGFPEKHQIQHAYQKGRELYDSCGEFVTDSIEQCPEYEAVFNEAPIRMEYLRGLEKRFQCAGVCSTALRLWDSAGTSVPGCGLFIAQWLHGAYVESQIILWYNVLTILVSVPLFILLLETFFENYYKPVMQ